jgi:protein phosphatase
MLLREAIQFATKTDAGLVRNFNEDNIALNPEIGLMVLADGMGGYKSGDVASHLATELIMKELQQSYVTLKPANGESSPSMCAQVVKDAVKKANYAIYRLAQSDSKYQNMGTTLALILFYNEHVTIAHVGDSRVYRLRDGRLKVLTYDHSLLQDQVAQGAISAEDAKVSHNRHLVTRALGMGKEITIDVKEEPVLPGDIYLVCSDGLNDMVEDSVIELAVKSLKNNLPLLASQLVMIANDNGGHDNISVMVAKVLQPFPASQGWVSKLFGWLR